MTTVRTEKHKDVFTILETLGTTISMLDALSILLEYAHRSGEELSPYSTGIERLFNQQCEDLIFIEKALRDQYRDIMDSKLEVRDLRMIAQWAAVTPQTAADVLFVAAGIRLPEQNEDTYQDLIENSQKVSILRAMQTAADIEAISKITDTPAEVVARVLNEAYVYNPHLKATAGGQPEKSREERGASHGGA